MVSDVGIREEFPLQRRAQLCGFLLLWRGLPASGDSLTRSSAAAAGTAKPLRGSGDGSTEAKAERGFLMKCKI